MNPGYSLIKTLYYVFIYLMVYYYHLKVFVHTHNTMMH